MAWLDEPRHPHQGLITASAAPIAENVPGVHVRVHTPIVKGTPAPWEPDDTCPATHSLSCARLDGGAVAITRTDHTLRMDFVWTPLTARLQEFLEKVRDKPGNAAPPVVTELEGDIVAWVDVDALDRVMRVPTANTSLLSQVQFQLTRIDTGVHASASFTPRDAASFTTNPRPPPAPSFASLCADAWLCAQTGEWPTPSTWRTRTRSATHERPGYAPWMRSLDEVDQLTHWPELFATLVQPPEQLRGVQYLVAAWDTLGTIESAGARFEGPSLDDAFIVYARLPRAQVGLIRGLLEYAKVPVDVVEAAPGLQVSYARPPGLRGGLVLAMDDVPEGGEPATMGHVAWVSSPQRFASLERFARTRRGSPWARARIEQTAKLSPQSLAPLTVIPGPWIDRRIEFELSNEAGKPTIFVWLDD